MSVIVKAHDVLHDPVWLSAYRRRKSEPEFVIGGLIHRRLSIWSGAVATGKTALAAGAVAALLNGEAEFLGQSVRREAQSVLWIFSDLDGGDEVHDRVSALLTDHGRTKALHVVEYAKDLDYLETARAVGADLVVIDNLLGIADHYGWDLGKSMDAARVLVPIERTAAEVPVLMIHHTAKPGAEGQGGLIGGQGHYGNTRITIKARTKGTLTLNRKKGNLRTLTIDNNRHEPVSLSLSLSVSGDVFRFQVVYPKTADKPKPNRRADEWNELAEKVIREQPSVTGVTPLGRFVVEQGWTGKSWSTARDRLGERLMHNGSTWVRKPNASSSS